MPANHPFHVSLKTQQQIAELHAKAKNCKRMKPSQLIQILIDALRLPGCA